MMNRLTREQQDRVVELVPLAERLAKTLRVETGVAYLALCEAVLAYRPGPASLKTYCWNCIRNACFGVIRKEGKDAKRPRRKEFTNYALENVADFAQSCALEALPDAEAEVAKMYWLELEPVERIQDILGLPAGRVRSLLEAAKSRLGALS